MFISSILPRFSPNNPKAPTKEDNKTGFIFVSNIRSRRYCPLSSQITIPLIPL
jgi:hypothetical protein